MKYRSLIPQGSWYQSVNFGTHLGTPSCLAHNISPREHHYITTKPTLGTYNSTRVSSSGNADVNQGSLSGRAKQKEADREFFTDLLSSAATNRDAKAYLKRLKSPTKVKSVPIRHEPPQPRVNLGNLFGRSHAVESSPVFSQYAAAEVPLEESERLHIALVKISDIDELPDSVLLGVAETLAQLHRLSMSPCVLLDPKVSGGHANKRRVTQQADRLVAAIASMNENGARRVDNVFSVSESKGVQVMLRDLLLRPLNRGQTPVVTPLAYSEDSNCLEIVGTRDSALALTKELAGLNARALAEDSPDNTKAAFESLQQQISLDRVITIDCAGGIPSSGSADSKHVFINLEQEFETVLSQLNADSHQDTSQHHAANLTLLRDALQLLPPESSGLMTTYTEAANPSKLAQDHDMSNVGTRRQKNALIHNLLTDKPAYSSSLPTGRLTRSRAEQNPVSFSTFVKRGMPVTILPDPTNQPWTGEGSRLKLTDPRIDLGRLVYLIEDSFNRKLDVQDYIRRVNDRIAGVIIAGEYEGGALLTWETPPGVKSNDETRLVPYLDKFAVLKRSQGAGGVADIVFNAMVRSCFPDGVCWRSRKDNPVNKWYFERSRGTWKIPDMNWTMFWTTPGVDESSQRFHDYESVCRGVEPSWADKKKAAD